MFSLLTNSQILELTEDEVSHVVADLSYYNDSKLLSLFLSDLQDLRPELYDFLTTIR